MAAIENELPPIVGDANLTVSNIPHYTGDAAHALEAARLTIRAQARQLAEVEAHLADVEADLARVRAACETGTTAATNRIAQASPDALRWEGKRAAYTEIWELIKPIS